MNSICETCKYFGECEDSLIERQNCSMYQKNEKN